jgi:hypothetical protein
LGLKKLKAEKDTRSEGKLPGEPGRGGRRRRSERDVGVATHFNLSGSSFDRQARYNRDSLTLPSRLPWAKAKALVRVMLDSLAASLVIAEGAVL